MIVIGDEKSPHYSVEAFRYLSKRLAARSIGSRAISLALFPEALDASVISLCSAAVSRTCTSLSRGSSTFGLPRGVMYPILPYTNKGCT